jgi:hypothetical protein
MRWIGVALVVLGIVGLVLGGFSFTKDEKKAEIGPLEIRVEEKERFPVPPWLGLVAIAAGLTLVALDVRRRRS